MLVPILMESKLNELHARKIAEVLTEFSVPVEIYITSSHKTPELALNIIEDINKKNDNVCYIIISSKTNSLGGIVSANSIHPVISCPEFKNDSDYLINIHSSINMPSDSPSMTIKNPKNAAVAAIKILALNEKSLKKQIIKYIDKIKE